MKAKTGERAILLLLVVYCVDLAWKLVNWGQLTKGLDWWMIAGALTVRFAVMGGLLVLFIRIRRTRPSGTNSQKPEQPDPSGAQLH
jgi:TRAP-type C4-dicarboxylate transport system permease small subunit